MPLSDAPCLVPPTSGQSPGSGERQTTPADLDPLGTAATPSAT